MPVPIAGNAGRLLAPKLPTKTDAGRPGGAGVGVGVGAGLGVGVGGVSEEPLPPGPLQFVRKHSARTRNRAV
ncbi:MAG: hypothetical protein DLM50_01925 [Candidatus Meridianibacter frigidus]|nr:MAG: hypothetical protein DLM50_01925 [Candidatus Eremiobacteraeota bacterium]